jgi:hypothetical protein
MIKFRLKDNIKMGLKGIGRRGGAVDWILLSQNRDK